MKALINFMNAAVGRLARVVLGLALMYLGVFALGGTIGGFALSVVGLVPIAMGLWGHCLLEIVSPQARHA